MKLKNDKTLKIALTAVFAALTQGGDVSQEFMLVYTTVIAFYFGTQTQKLSDAVEDGRP